MDDNFESLSVLGPGSSGKTEFLLDKFSELLKKGAAPDRIAVFCRIPLRERFLERVRRHSPNGYREVVIDSFSGFAKRAVRMSHYKFGVQPDFTIISGKEEEIVIGDVLSRPGIRKSLKYFGRVADFPGFRKELVDFIDNFKIAPAEFPPPDELFPVIEAYNELLKRRNLLDLRDIENLCLRTVEKGLFSRSFDYIFLDGWEDMNRKEADIFFTLIGKSETLKGVYCAGDAESGIFGFLAAVPEKTEKLIRRRFSENKVLDKKSEAPAELRSFISLFDEAEWILSEIRALINSGVKPDDIAVLFRDVSDELKMVEDMAALEGVPASVASGAPFFKHPSFVSFFSFLEAVSRRGAEARNAEMLRLPVFGLGASDILKATAGTPRERRAVEKKINSVLGAASDKVSSARSFPEKVYAVFESSGLKNEISRSLPLSRLFGYFFEYTDKLAQISPSPDFTGFVALMNEAMKSFSRAPYMGEFTGAVKLLTVHESRGLHFDYVFAPGASRGRFPREFKQDVYLDLGRSEEKHYRTEERIFRSAMSRALKKTYVSFVRPESGNAPVSPYIEGLSESGRIPKVTNAGIYSLSAVMKKAAASERAAAIPAPKKVSASALEEYIDCPFMYFLDNVLKIKTAKGASLVCGILVHSILEKFHGEFPAPGEAEKMRKRIVSLTDAQFSRDNPAADFEDEYARKCWKDFFRGFLEKYALSRKKFHVEAREKRIEVVTRGVKITGRIDRIDKTAGGLREIIDYKTSPSARAKFKKNALLSRIADGRQVALPVYFKAVEGAGKISIEWLADYEKPEKYPEKVSVETSCAEFTEAMAGMEKTVAAALDGIKAAKFHPSADCRKNRYCRYGALCGFMKGESEE